MAGGVTITVALSVAGFGFAALFSRHVERNLIAELEARSLTLTARLEPQVNGVFFREGPLMNPLYRKPYSGQYWQVLIGETLRTSRSLWDFSLSLPPAGQIGEVRIIELEGPDGQALVAIDRALVAGGGANATPLRITVAADRAELAEARQDFLKDLFPGLAMLGLALLLASAIQIHVGLRPLKVMQERVAELVAGRRRRIGGDLPAELAPLVQELDHLLESGETELEKARRRAADLAHGFKTPLQALMGDADRLRSQGRAEIADNIEGVAGSMREHVDRELARFRLRSDNRPAPLDPEPVLSRVANVIQRTPAGAELRWEVECEPGLALRIDPVALTEAAGALMENAARYARNRVSIRAFTRGGRAYITVADDGPGVREEELHTILGRGVRFDQKTGGHGIGLSIVAEIAEDAFGELQIRNGTPGLIAELILPVEGG